MRRKLLLICISILLFAGVWIPAGVFADADHPITMTIQCDPDPELETGGTIPDLLFTIRNNGKEDYTLDFATLTGGYEDRTLVLDEHITVLAGGTKEFHLTDVAISDEQLDTTVVYRLAWKETELVIDNEEGTSTAIQHEREAEAEIRIERFVPPELSVTASAPVERVRVGETFTVVYTITNDTKFDMSALKLYDPEQSMQSIGLPSTELFAGESKSIEVTYTMGKEDMSFSPAVEYTVRQREQMTRSETMLTVESVVVELTLKVEDHSATSEGTSFLVSVHNGGNHTVTNIQLYDEINTPIDAPFDLAPDQSKVLKYAVPSAISSEIIRKVQFHAEATDVFDTVFTVTDPNQYEVIPVVEGDSVKISLYVVLQRAYYDENGKLCGSIQFEIRNYSTVKMRNATLTELNLFGDLASYEELQNGETWAIKSLQLDGVPELAFNVSADDPAGQRCTSETIRLDLSRLKQLADQTNDPVYVYPNNPYLKDLDVKYRSVLRIAGLIVLIVSIACAIVCIVLYAIERNLKAKLPPEIEENMENELRKSKRRAEPQIFGDAPTEQFGYTVPVKLRDYGELTEQEAEARRKEYADKLSENLREYRSSPATIVKTAEPEETNTIDSAYTATRIIPVSRVKSASVRDDIKLIPVNPVEPKPDRTEEKPKPKRVRERANAQTAKPKSEKPKQMPEKFRSDSAQQMPEPEKQKPAGSQTEPVKASAEQGEAKPVRTEYEVPEKRIPAPSAGTQRREQQQLTIADAAPDRIMSANMQQQSEPPQDSSTGDARRPSEQQHEYRPFGYPETREPQKPPRVIDPIERPRKRPVEEHRIKRMNG